MLATIGIVAQSSGFLPAGTLISTFCQSTSGNDAIGTYYEGAWTAIGVYANGSGGTYNSSIGNNTSGCFYPAGYYISFSQYDVYLNWTSPFESGQFIYGYTNAWTVSDGVGGELNSGQTVVTAANGQVVTQWSGTNTSGYPTTFKLVFNANNISIEQFEFIVAGTILSQGCVQIVVQDADALTWNVYSNQFIYADGSGGTYTVNNLNTAQCGYLPAGYVSGKVVQDRTIAYTTYEGEGLAFIYGELTIRDIQDGNGNFTSTSDMVWYFSAGYIFYSYYDGAGLQNVNYVYDGNAGYVIEYVPI